MKTLGAGIGFILLAALLWALVPENGDAPGGLESIRQDPNPQDDLSALHSPADPGALRRTSVHKEMQPADAELRAAPGEPGPEETIVRGRVLLTDDRPAEGAKIEIRGRSANDRRRIEFGMRGDWETLTGRTDADGLFALRFEPPRAFQFLMEIHHTGHATAAWRWPKLERGQVKDVGEVRLELAGAVEGLVLDAAGKPLGGEWVVYADAVRQRDQQGSAMIELPSHSATALPWGGRTPIRGWAQADPTTGHFHIDGLPAGYAHLKAHSRADGWIWGGGVVIAAGEVVEADFRYEDRSQQMRAFELIRRD